jgi:hypothetical protein
MHNTIADSIVEDTALLDRLLPKLISGEQRINVGGPYVDEATR